MRLTELYPAASGRTYVLVHGAWVGKRITHKVLEAGFRRVFRVLVSLIALRLIYKGVML